MEEETFSDIDLPNENAEDQLEEKIVIFLWAHIGFFLKEGKKIAPIKMLYLLFEKKKRFYKNVLIWIQQLSFFTSNDWVILSIFYRYTLRASKEIKPQRER